MDVYLIALYLVFGIYCSIKIKRGREIATIFWSKTKFKLMVFSQGSPLGAALSLSVATIGAGVLTFPSAFASAGVIESLIVLAIVGIFTVISIRYLILCVDFLRLCSYEDISRELLGPTFEQVVRWMLIAINYGCAVGYIVVAGELMEPFQSSITTAVPFLENRVTSLIALWFVILLPLSLVRNIGTLNVSSFLAVVATNFIAVAVVIRYFYPEQPPRTHQDYLPSVVNLTTPVHVTHERELARKHTSGSDVATTLAPAALAIATSQIHMFSWNWVALMSLPIMMFSFDCQAYVFQIYFSLKDRSIKAMDRVSFLSVAISTSVYSAVGIFGYLSHGDNVRGNIINNYDPKTDKLFGFAYVLYAVPVCMAFALVMFPTRDAVFNFLYGYSAGSTDVAISDRQFYVTSILISITALVCAIFTPGIVTIVALLGGLCSSTLCFIYPALFRLRLHHLGILKANAEERYVVYAMLGLGVFGAIFGTGIGISNLMGFT